MHLQAPEHSHREQPLQPVYGPHRNPCYRPLPLLLALFPYPNEELLRIPEMTARLHFSSPFRELLFDFLTNFRLTQSLSNAIFNNRLEPLIDGLIVFESVDRVLVPLLPIRSSDIAVDVPCEVVQSFTILRRSGTRERLGLPRAMTVC